MAQHLQKVQGQPNLFLNLDSGIYWVRAMIDGQQKWRSTRKTTLKAAISAARTVLGGLEEARGKVSTKDPTLAEWWGVYRKATRKAESTWKIHDLIMRLHILPQFGSWKLTEIDRPTIQRHLNWRRHTASEGTVNGELRLLHAVLQANVDSDHGVLKQNPLRGLKPTKVPPRTQVVSREDQAKVEAHMKGNVKRYFLFLLGTGIRADEATRLRAGDIDWDKGQFTVMGKGSKVRTVPMVPDAAADLQRLLTEQLDAKGKLWPQNQSSYRRSLLLACEKAGVTPFTAHILRHTFATRYLQGGGDIYILSKILGHASVTLTERVYAHITAPDLVVRSQGIDVGVNYGKEADSVERGEKAG